MTNIRQKTFLTRRFPIILVLFAVSACSPPRQVVRVSARPEAPPKRQEDVSQEMPTPEASPYADATVGRFDDGRMWTFENPPIDWIKSEYGITIDEAWLTKARRGALKFGEGCSASLISPNGLVMTNHHCARDWVSMISGPDEELLDNGFYASDTTAERKIRDLSVRQLISIEDVSKEVTGAAKGVKGEGPRSEARQKRMDSIQRRMTERFGSEATEREAELVERVPGQIYSALTFRTYNDVRLVWVPELQLGQFGGETDNFTYPRHTLDVAFFRIWEDGAPLQTSDFFTWDLTGADPGEAVFVIGNPGSTKRLVTVSQLEFLRDTQLPPALEILADRTNVLELFLGGIISETDSFDVRNDLMSARNMQKALEGQYRALLDGTVISKTQAWERSVEAFLDSTDTEMAEFKSIFRDLTLIQQSKRISARRAAAFTQFMNPSISSHILARAMYGYVYALSKQRGAPPEVLKDIFDDGVKIEDWPPELEKAIIAQRLRDFETALGAEDPTVRRMFAGISAEALADSIVTYTALGDSTGFRDILEVNYLASKDVTVDLVNMIGSLYFTVDAELQQLREREDQLLKRLAQIRFEIDGNAAPPDADFSLRLMDGRVAGYAVNGKKRPAYTTFGSMYQLADSLYGQEEWDLPQRWVEARDQIDQAVPLNLVSTNDIAGGNSGSPLLDAQLRIVGLVLDGNLESLQNEYVFEDTFGRTISVDVRAIIEALESLEDADRLILEILDRRFLGSEEEADALR